MSKKHSLPDIKYEKVGKSNIKEVELPNGQKTQEETFTEKEIEVKNLVKIAPLYFFCPDNNKVLMIPFSIQFSVHEFLKSCATAATSMEDILDSIEKKRKEVKNGKNT